MSLRDQVKQALTAAMKAREQDRVSTFRLINAAINDRDIALRGELGEGAAPADDAAITAILAKMVKQRQESARAYEEGGRVDLAQKEQAEIEIIATLLPRQLSDAEAEAAVAAAIAATGASSLRDMGQVMAHLKANYAGQMDFGAVGPKVRALLA